MQVTQSWRLQKHSVHVRWLHMCVGLAKPCAKTNKQTKNYRWEKLLGQGFLNVPPMNLQWTSKQQYEGQGQGDFFSTWLSCAAALSTILNLLPLSVGLLLGSRWPMIPKHWFLIDTEISTYLHCMSRWEYRIYFHNMITWEMIYKTSWNIFEHDPFCLLGFKMIDFVFEI